MLRDNAVRFRILLYRGTRSVGHDTYCLMWYEVSAFQRSPETLEIGGFELLVT